MRVPEKSARAVAEIINGACASASAISAPSIGMTAGDLSGAYQVQHQLEILRKAAGDRVAGYKIGLTNVTSQSVFETNEPVRGILFRSMIHGSPGKISRGSLVAPKVEAELAFVFGTSVPKTRITKQSLSEAVVAVAPALEIVDSRVEGWATNAVDLVTDNSASSAVVLGQQHRFHPGLKLPDQCELLTGDATVPGSRDAVEGGLWASLEWLAFHLAKYERGIERGQIVMSGSWTVPSPVATTARPQSVQARFPLLGLVEATLA